MRFEVWVILQLITLFAILMFFVVLRGGIIGGGGVGSRCAHLRGPFQPTVLGWASVGGRGRFGGDGEMRSKASL